MLPGCIGTIRTEIYVQVTVRATQYILCGLVQSDILMSLMTGKKSMTIFRKRFCHA